MHICCRDRSAYMLCTTHRRVCWTCRQIAYHSELHVLKRLWKLENLGNVLWRSQILENSCKVASTFCIMYQCCIRIIHLHMLYASCVPQRRQTPLLTSIIDMNSWKKTILSCNFLNLMLYCRVSVISRTLACCLYCWPPTKLPRSQSRPYTQNVSRWVDSASISWLACQRLHWVHASTTLHLYSYHFMLNCACIHSVCWCCSCFIACRVSGGLRSVLAWLLSLPFCSTASYFLGCASIPITPLGHSPHLIP